MPIMVVFIFTFFISFIITIITTPIIIKFALSRGFVDKPNERKIHKNPIPRLGGIPIFLGFAAAIAFLTTCSYLKLVHINMHLFLGLSISGTIVFLLGLVDDLVGLRAVVKLVWQVIAASIAIYFGFHINILSNPFNGAINLLPLISIPLSLLWITGVTNAINLIDGLDGLAAGVCAISSGTLFFVALRTHEIGAALLLLALSGAALGFLKYNFFPAKIFLGDSGSYFLGFILACASILGVFKTTLVVALIIPLLILGVPIFDTLFAIGRRVSNGKSPFDADNKHIHHMFLRAGFTQREAVLSIYIACFLLSIGALLMALQK